MNPRDIILWLGLFEGMKPDGGCGVVPPLIAFVVLLCIAMVVFPAVAALVFWQVRQLLRERKGK